LFELNGSGRRYGYDDAELRRWLETAGFEEYPYRPFERRLVACRDGRPDAASSLFLRDRAFVDTRRWDARPIEVHGWRI
jgi:hypothetical protein